MPSNFSKSEAEESKIEELVNLAISKGMMFQQDRFDGITLRRHKNNLVKKGLQAVSLARKEDICKTCGFPDSLERDPVFLTDNIFSIIHYDVNTCEECGHQEDGSTITLLQPYIRDLVVKVEARVRKETTKEEIDSLERLADCLKNYRCGNHIVLTGAIRIMIKNKKRFLFDVESESEGEKK